MLSLAPRAPSLFLEPLLGSLHAPLPCPQSYAGKYVPSITHYILQLQEATQEGGQRALDEQQDQRDGRNAGPVLPYVQLQRRRPLAPGPRPSRPLFRLMGAAIG